MKYRKKLVVIEALQWDGNNTREIIEFIGQKVDNFFESQEMFQNYCNLVLKCGLSICTLEGPKTASVGDYIIRGVQGEFYPCKPDIFVSTYEKA